MTTVIGETRKAVDRARRMVFASLDVAQVPKDDPVERQANNAFISLERVLEDLPDAGITAAALEDPGPVVYVMPKRDMRDWPTTEGRSAAKAILPKSRQARRLASISTPILASRKLVNRRAISAAEYLRCLEEAIPVASPFSKIGGDHVLVSLGS